jgi:hypothetical protein
MNDMDTSPRSELDGFPSGADSSNPLPTNWREALLGLIAARFALIQIESKQAAKAGAGRAARLVAAVICVFFTWALILAGGIAALSHQTGWPWAWIALAAGGLHLVAAIILFQTAGRGAAPTFIATRAEFQKDREWIENFQKNPKSNG